MRGFVVRCVGPVLLNVLGKCATQECLLLVPDVSVVSVHGSGRTFHSPHPKLLSTSHCILLSQYQGTCADNLLALLGFGNIRYSVIIYGLYYPSFRIYWLLILNGRFLLVFFCEKCQSGWLLDSLQMTMWQTDGGTYRFPLHLHRLQRAYR